jgi:uncharacterized protein YndB with AHSA1/START domain
MRFEFEVERTYRHDPAKVWRALTDPAALGAWLMETDFAAEVGRAFWMRCDDGRGGTDLYLCKVLALEPQRRMVWSWRRDAEEGAGETQVEFRLEEVAGGTRLTVRHSGDLAPAWIERFKGGWPLKLDLLDGVLGAAGEQKTPS